MLRAFIISVGVVVVLAISLLIPGSQSPEHSGTESSSQVLEPIPREKAPIRVASLSGTSSSSSDETAGRALARQLAQSRGLGSSTVWSTVNSASDQAPNLSILDSRQVALFPSPPGLVQAPQTPGAVGQAGAVQQLIASAPPGYFAQQTNGVPAGYGPGPILDSNGQIIGMVPANSPQAMVDPRALGMVPDFSAAQSFTLVGNANGPDLSAKPMEFTPVTDFGDVFSYNATPQWVRQRWPRVSNCPADANLRGQRVALVTGTNSWDLHGSLTYYFDEYQKCRRITFRGWAGDASRFVQFLQQNHGFKQQPTNWAGFYLAKSWRKTSGGLLMKNPPVTYAENKVQQVGVLLEMNDQQSKFSLSQDFASLVEGSQQQQRR